MPTLARRLAEYAASVRFEDLPAPVVHEVKRRVLDSLGCAWGAYGSDVGQIARAVATGSESRPGSSVLGLVHSAVPELAAFANGALVRYLDFNDTYLSLEPAHPSDNIPACLAAAEAAGADGRALIAAIALAYEVQCRLCDAASIRARRWDHVTYGCFSTALAAGKLLGLGVEALEQAVNLAGVNSAAMRQTRVGQLSMWKGCAFANAARNGVFAARLAALGMTGPEEIFEGPMGFFQQVSGPFELEIEKWGPPRMIRETSIKFWPAEYHSQSAIDAALSVRQEVGDVSNIRKIEILSFDAAVDIIGSEPEKWHPTTRETADHSMPYCVAVALLDGQVGLAQFDEARILRPDVQELMQKITITRDADLTERYPEGIPNRLEIATWQGQTLTREVTHPRGHARNPMTDEEVSAKFRSLARCVLPEDRARAQEERVWALENQQPAEILRA
ncbi:MAG TPA: MmgE/PrpD family protein [Armatimonadota bacterium]|nr:MmgE/PrpD family protein [Armatimonadota bacterium]